MRELKIFSGQANAKLAHDICGFLHLPLGEISLGKFPDGENFCKIEEDVRGRDVYLIQPTCPPVNDNLMELLVMIDSCKRASAARITAVLPYYAKGSRIMLNLEQESIIWILREGTFVQIMETFP